MTIQSMTGFGKGEAKDENYAVSVEIKSVNNRFKDIRFKLPSHLNSYEMELREMLQAKFIRGTFDVFVGVRKAEGKNRFDDLDDQKIDQFLEKILPAFKKKEITYSFNPTDFLRSEFYKDQENTTDELKGLVLKAFDQALNQLEESRLTEGAKLTTLLVNHCEEFKKAFKTIEGNADKFTTHVEEKLRKRVQEYKNEVNVENSRMLQEIVFYLEKIDVHEEINRLHSHLEKFQNLLKLKGEVGRQIDFILQEMNRETNTIGSKSNLKEISDEVVKMKMQLEKMREQGLNLE